MPGSTKLNRGDLRVARRRGDVALLLSALQEPDLRGLALAFLGGLKAPEAVGPATLLLASGDTGTRSAAALTLRRIGDPEAVPALIKQVMIERERVPRTHMIGALRELGDQRAVEPLCELLEDEDVYVRAASALALGVLGDPRVLGRVEAAAAAERWYNRKHFRRAIKRLRQIAADRNAADIANLS